MKVNDGRGEKDEITLEDEDGRDSDCVRDPVNDGDSRIFAGAAAGAWRAA